MQIVLKEFTDSTDYIKLEVQPSSVISNITPFSGAEDSSPSSVASSNGVVRNNSQRSSKGSQDMTSEEIKQRRRSINAERQRNKRRDESPNTKERRRALNAQRQRERRANESPETRRKRLDANAAYQRKRRAEESPTTRQRRKDSELAKRNLRKSRTSMDPSGRNTPKYENSNENSSAPISIRSTSPVNIKEEYNSVPENHQNMMSINNNISQHHGQTITQIQQIPPQVMVILPSENNNPMINQEVMNTTQGTLMTPITDGQPCYIVTSPMSASAYVHSSMFLQQQSTNQATNLTNMSNL
uniref:BZIP domain-containing protein n=1 Tax=Parastrongyloides trichosuri TaxID=131310 RepID=A0A0N4Z6N6_PARTI